MKRSASAVSAEEMARHLGARGLQRLDRDAALVEDLGDVLADADGGVHPRAGSTLRNVRLMSPSEVGLWIVEVSVGAAVSRSWAV